VISGQGGFTKLSISHEDDLSIVNGVIIAKQPAYKLPLSVSPDDVIARDRTGPDGSFSLSGESHDTYGNIDPRLRLFHRCDQGDILPHVCFISFFIEKTLNYRRATVKFVLNCQN
jgi:hypothetical protein